MKLERLAGILLHPTSLPGKYGIGDFGLEAMNFIDFLKDADQGLWQILPISPTGFRDSPYQSFSTFAGNTLIISPDELIKKNYLKQPELTEFDAEKIDYGKVIEYKEGLYRESFKGFKLNPRKKEFYEFLEKNSFWLSDYALFMSIKQFFIKQRKFEGFSKGYEEFKKKAADYLDDGAVMDYYFGGAWATWPADILNRDEEAVKKYTELLSEEIEYHSFLQYEFFCQWDRIREYANKNGIKIIGDIPIYIAYDSADCWAFKELFLLEENGFPKEVAGVPPDYFSETGQLWGNPLYDWEAMRETGFEWWIKRLEQAHRLCDYMRIDHFRGFDTYWSVPFGEKTAINGKWKIGPGEALFNSIYKQLGELQIVAEDLGEPAETVVELRKRFELPGMKVLQFAFDSDNANTFLPHNFDDINSVVYTGTHDNDTTAGWFSDASGSAKDYVRRYMNVDGSDISWDMVRLAYSSIAAFAIVPLQDCLSLGKEARMNIPGSASGNWQWRFRDGAAGKDIADGLKYLARLYARTPKNNL